MQTGSVSAGSLLKRVIGALMIVTFSLWLSGCASEAGNKIAVQTVGTGSPQQEWGTEWPVDARGYVNGVFTPETKPQFKGPYPITYTGSWTIQIVGTKGQPIYSALGERVGDRVNIVGSFTRVIFEFHDPLMYANPGTVTFLKNDASLGSFVLNSKDSRGDRIMHYQITNMDGKFATYTMVLNSGHVVLTGYALSHLYMVDEW